MWRFEKFSLIPLHPTYHWNAGFKVRKARIFLATVIVKEKPAVTGGKEMNFCDKTITVTPRKCQCYPYLIPVILEAFRVSLRLAPITRSKLFLPSPVLPVTLWKSNCTILFGWGRQTSWGRKELRGPQKLPF